MVPFLLVLYTLGIIFLVLFLLTGKVLKPQLGLSLSRSMKALHAFNLLSFVWVIMTLVGFGFHDVLAVTMEPSLWPQFITFLNEAFGYATFFSLFSFLLVSLAVLVAGYTSNPRADYMPVNAMSSVWQSIFTFLFIILGITGATVGILT